MEDTSFKRRLRAEFRAARRNLESVDRRKADQRINQEILDLVVRMRTGPFSVSAYLSFDGEPDVRPALATLHGQGIRVVVPAVVGASGSTQLEFRDWTPDGPMATGTHGIDEPDEGSTVAPENLDMLLIPLVAWDQCGHRLGMGAGYYDRALASLAGSRRPLRVGVAYALQKHSGLPADDWDVPLHEVITDEGRFTCGA